MRVYELVGIDPVVASVPPANRGGRWTPHDPQRVAVALDDTPHSVFPGFGTSYVVLRECFFGHEVGIEDSTEDSSEAVTSSKSERIRETGKAKSGIAAFYSAMRTREIFMPNIDGLLIYSTGTPVGGGLLVADVDSVAFPAPGTVLRGIYKDQMQQAAASMTLPSIRPSKFRVSRPVRWDSTTLVHFALWQQLLGSIATGISNGIFRRLCYHSALIHSFAYRADVRLGELLLLSEDSEPDASQWGGANS